MPYLFYVVVKIVAYTAWCWVGLRLWRPSSAAATKAISFGIIRLAIGIAFGVVIFFTVSTQRQDLLWKYVTIYTPVRAFEWFILALLIGRKSDKFQISAVVFWCLSGILVSFAADFASPEGVAGHFCVGRCLC